MRPCFSKNEEKRQHTPARMPVPPDESTFQWRAQPSSSCSSVLFAILLACSARPGSAQIIVFDRWEPSENIVTFESRAPAELVIGRTRSVGGVLRMVSQLIAGASGEVLIQTESFKSGVELRDATIRSSDWLNAQTYPIAQLSINRLIADKSVFGVSQAVEVQSKGILEIRGVTQEITIPTTLCYMPPYFLGNPDARLSIKGKFKVKIGEFGMRIPAAHTARVNPEIVVSFNLLARGSRVSSWSSVWDRAAPPAKIPQATTELTTKDSEPE
ncbi:MAG: YceI family protein, partial [bacterium]